MNTLRNLVCLIFAAIFIGIAKAQCTSETYGSLVPVLTVLDKYPNNSLPLANAIIEALPAGLAFGSEAPLYSIGFKAVADLLDKAYNVTRKQPDSKLRTLLDAAELCTLYNSLLNEGSSLLNEFINPSNLAYLFDVIGRGINNSLTEQPAGSNFTANYWTNNAPGAVKLAFIPNGMVVSWQTLGDYAAGSPPQVSYGTDANNLASSSQGSTHTYNTVYFHDVVLSNLSPNTIYYYTISGDADQRQFQFLTAPVVGTQNGPVTTIVIGDMGIVNAEATFDSLSQEVTTADFVIHIGDISYADDYFLRPEFAQYDTYESTWNEWQSWLSGVTSGTPYMVCPGNHEAECQLALPYNLCPITQQNFTAYRNRFRMPNVESGAGQVQNMWYSFNYGLVHYVMIDTESDFPGSPEGNLTTTDIAGPFGGQDGIPTQLSWLATDLSSVNRTLTPWVIVMGHRPMYSGIAGVINTDSLRLSVPTAFVPLFELYNIDMYISGHMHLYERLLPIWNGVGQSYSSNVYLNPTAPTYIINGAAGNDEELDTVTSYNYSIGAFYDDAHYGYGKLIIYNDTHIQWQYMDSASGVMSDNLWLVQSKGDGYVHSSTTSTQITTTNFGGSTTHGSDASTVVLSWMLFVIVILSFSL